MRPDLEVRWEVPAAPGALDRLFGPGKTRSETVAELAGGAVVLALVVAYTLMWPPVPRPLGERLLLAVILLDLCGGILTHATQAAKRWFHRAASPRRRLTFVAVHVVHLAAVALFLLDDLTFLALNAALLAVSAPLVEAAPVEARRVVASAAVLTAALGNTALHLPSDLALVPVLFFTKLLVGHLVPEAPLYRPESGHRVS